MSRVEDADRHTVLRAAENDVEAWLCSGVGAVDGDLRHTDEYLAGVARGAALALAWNPTNSDLPPLLVEMVERDQ